MILNPDFPISGIMHGVYNFYSLSGRRLIPTQPAPRSYDSLVWSISPVGLTRAAHRSGPGRVQGSYALGHIDDGLL